MCYYLPVFLCLFESFRRDLNEAKAVYISEYYLACRFVIMTLRLHLKFIYFSAVQIYDLSSIHAHSSPSTAILRTNNVTSSQLA